MLRTHVLPRWGDAKLADVAHEQVAAWIAELRSTGLSASTVRQAHLVLSLVLALAVRDGRLASVTPACGTARWQRCVLATSTCSGGGR